MAYETSLTTPSEANQGEEVSIEALIECTRDSGQCDTHDFEVDVDGEVVYSASFTLLPTVFEIPMNEATTETDDWEILDDGELVFKSPGTYTITLSGTDGSSVSDTIEVTGASEIKMVGCDLSAGRVEAGETFEATATIENTGALDGETVVQLMDGEGEIASETVVVPGGEQVDVTFDVVYETTGEYDIGIEYSTA